jgi:hypothetical protein
MYEPCWCTDLVPALEDLRPGLALEWATACARALVAQAAPPECKEKLLSSLDELAQCGNPAALSDLMQKHHALWHGHPCPSPSQAMLLHGFPQSYRTASEQLSLMESAISSLSSALSDLLNNHGRRYRMLVTRAVDVMGEHPFYRQSSLAIPLDLFEKFMATASTVT